MSWPTIPLKRIAVLTAGGTPAVGDPTYWSDGDEGHAWVSISDMSSVDAVTSTARRVSDAGLRSARIALGDPGTLLFSMYASLGHTAWLSTPAAWNQAILGLRPDSSTDSRFLRYSLVSLRPTLSDQARSNTQSNLNAEQVGNLAIPHPSLNEQRRVADFLDVETARIDEMVSRCQRLLMLANERDQSLLDSSLEAMSEKGGVIPFRRFILGVDQGSSPQCDAIPAENGEWGVLKVSCLRPGLFNPRENKRLPPGVEPDVRAEVKRGDLLITRANTPALVGSTAVVKDVRPGLLLCDKIFRVRVSSELDPEFLAVVARGSRVRASSAATSNGASQSMANLRIEEIKEWSIPAVKLSDQQRLVALVSESHSVVMDLKDKVDRQLTLLAERRQTLITAAVTGQLDVTTAHPAHHSL
ncbi:restriction endonuclease subunit S [Streptomyces erythrochromogenes]|uniref:restriction endonuclease subunit S n=1 Tax=Streptomyces erythrochromogenes TaxID=285574 RepID=UPI00368DE179